jgi:C4-dicarboxylate-specific signal transduction histidine kinase
MLILTATGLIVGVVVSEREHADSVARDAEARLKQKEAEAAQAARFALVSGLASALAHEINQPMTAARALARSAQHILQTPQPDLARAEGNLAKMIAQIDHAGGVVRRMRDFLRRGHPHVSTIDLPNLIEGALALVLPDAAAKRIRIDTEGIGDLPLLYGDRVQLQQVILNLVHNAIDALVAARVTDGHIRIVGALHEAPHRIEIGVIDNGPGMDAAQAERLFQPLTTSKSEGLGLGLSICAAILEAHGGRIWLQQHRPGATEFRLSLPLDRPQLA